MPGIIPELVDGAVEIRATDGTCFGDAGGVVSNGYCPDPLFTVTCAVNALPDGCGAVITTAQVNGFMSEMLCLAEGMDPDGTWDCGSVCNLSTAFTNWATSQDDVSLWRQMQSHLCAMAEMDDAAYEANPNASFIVCDGSGNLFNYTGRPLSSGQEAADAVCADAVARQTLRDCLGPTVQAGDGITVTETAGPEGQPIYEVEVTPGEFLLASNNLSDVDSIPVARINMGVNITALGGVDDLDDLDASVFDNHFYQWLSPPANAPFEDAAMHQSTDGLRRTQLAWSGEQTGTGPNIAVRREGFGGTWGPWVYFVTENTPQTLINKTMDAASNTFTGFRHGFEVDDPSSGVHGVVGDVVGTTDAQTLTDKVLGANTEVAVGGDAEGEIWYRNAAGLLTPLPIGPADQVLTVNPGGTAPEWRPFTSGGFTSAPQTITTGGLVTVDHGLGAIPRHVTPRLVCTTAERNYSIGDIIYPSWNCTSASTDRINTPIADATNVSVRFSAASNCFQVGNATTGGSSDLTNSNWDLIIEASL